jgi:predicted component of viral defense system (DUF524 family)
MSSPVGVVQLPLTTAQGQVAGSLRILARTPDSLFQLSEAEANGRGEEVLQLVEGRSYEFALQINSSSNYRLRETRVVQPSQLAIGIGRIEPGLATGLLPIVLENKQLEEVARGKVEVRSAKLNYHLDYRHMLDYIAEMSINLLMDIHAPSQIRMTSDENLNFTTLHERFAFLRHLLASQTFNDAINRVVSMPHHRAELTRLNANIRQGLRPGRSVTSTLARGGHRMPLPPSHPLHVEMLAAGIQQPSLPLRFKTNRSTDTRNTPENQFVKHALNDFLNVLIDIENRLTANGTLSDLRLVREVTQLRQSIAEYLDCELFKEVGDATMLPLGSAVLQKRNGYREVLEAWLRFSLAAQLSWSGGEEVFGGGKKDVALLYEYWLFFVLLELVTHELQIDTPGAAMLLELTSSGFDMRLKAGTTFSLEGLYSKGSSPIRTRFSYNRTFSGRPTNIGRTYPFAGSWTRPMRPDFTLSFWPSEFSEDEAEWQELIVHIHFDAKYRVESITGLFGSEIQTELDDENTATHANAGPKRSDLLKMHAYRDAIRRTEGAFVLYPGPVSGDHSWVEYHEILPGLGAFSVRPGHEEAAKLTLAQFIRDILDHMSDPSTRRRQQAFQTFRVQSP